MGEDRRIDPVEYGMLVQQVAHLTSEVKSMKDNVQAMRDLMEQGKGSWKTLVYLGGLASLLGAAGAWLATHIKWTP
jgi:hypothetical protein